MKRPLFLTEEDYQVLYGPMPKDRKRPSEALGCGFGNLPDDTAGRRILRTPQDQERSVDDGE